MIIRVSLRRRLGRRYVFINLGFASIRPGFGVFDFAIDAILSEVEAECCRGFVP